MPENSANQYTVPVSFDTSQSVKEVQDMIDGLNAATRAAAEIGKTAQTAMKQTTDATNAAANAVDGIAENLGEASAAAHNLKNEATAAGKATQQSMDEKPIQKQTTFWQRLVGVVRSFTQGVKEGYSEAVQGAKRAGEEQEKAAKKTQASLGGLNSMLQKGAGLVAGYFGVQALIDFGRQIVQTTALFEKMQATLTVALGSGSAAAAAMDRIQELAKTTPFGVEELTQSFIKLVNRGFIPTNAELVKLGDLAASQGKSIDQLIEAVLDAQTGEYERLKEFGIRASQANGQVMLSFRGVTQTVKLTDEAVRNALLSFGEMEGVLGAMSNQAATTGGSISNLQDNWQLFTKNMGTIFMPAITAVLEVLNGVVGALQDTSEWLNKLNPQYDIAKSGAEAYALATERLTEAAKKGSATMRGETLLLFQDLEANAKQIADLQKQLAAVPDNFFNRAQRQSLEESIANIQKIDKETRQAYADFFVQQKKIDDQRKAASIPTAAELAKAEQDRLKAQRLANEQTKQRIALEKQLRDVEARGNDNKYEVQQDQLAASLESATAELDNQARVINQSKILSQDQVESLELINKIKIQLQQNYYRDSIRLAEQYTQDQVKKEFDYQARILALQKDGRNKALAEVDAWEREQMQAAREQYADDLVKRTNLQFEISQAAERRRKEITGQFYLQEINQEAELQEALTEISSKYADHSLRSERLKQQEILKIKIDAAERSATLLEASGTIEGQIQAAQLRKVIADMRKELDTLRQGGGDNALAEFLGLSEDDLKQLDKYIDKVEAVAGVINKVTGVILASVQRQIEAKDQQIEKYNEEIDELQKNVDTQRELAEEGKANSLQAAEDELSEKEKLRDEEIRQREELQKKAEKLQAAQMVLDTISQASNLVTAASKIFAAYADIPFIGVALAAAAVVAMIAAFTSAKSNASAAVSASYGEGGEIDGASHDTTGVKYRSVSKGHNRTIELEGGEYVIKKRSTAKHKRLAEALNNDDFTNLPFLDHTFQQMLNEMGIHVPEDDQKGDALRTYNEVQAAPVYVYNVSTGKTEAILNGIRQEVKYLADEKRQEEKVLFETDKVKRVKTGNRTRLIRKAHG